jgi:hypothetical protein
LVERGRFLNISFELATNDRRTRQSETRQAAGQTQAGPTASVEEGGEVMADDAGLPAVESPLGEQLLQVIDDYIESHPEIAQAQQATSEWQAEPGGELADFLSIVNRAFDRIPVGFAGAQSGGPLLIQRRV